MDYFASAPATIFGKMLRYFPELMPPQNRPTKSPVRGMSLAEAEATLKQLRARSTAAPRLQTNSISEAKRVLSQLRARASALPHLTTNSLAEAEGILDKIHDRQAIADRRVRNCEILQARTWLARLGLPVKGR